LGRPVWKEAEKSSGHTQLTEGDVGGNQWMGKSIKKSKSGGSIKEKESEKKRKIGGGGELVLISHLGRGRGGLSIYRQAVIVPSRSVD